MGAPGIASLVRALAKAPALRNAGGDADRWLFGRQVGPCMQSLSLGRRRAMQVTMIVHRLLDAVFRTLDTVDALRVRIDAVLGRSDAQPASSWPAVVEVNINDADDVRAGAVAPADLDASRSKPEAPAPEKSKTTTRAAAKPNTATKTATRTATKTATRTKKATPAATVPKTARASATAARPKKTPTDQPDVASTPPSSSSRKGSVDRSGKDFDSPRARAVEGWLKEHGGAIVAEDATLNGKRTLARVLWAVALAEQAGSEHGLTAADTSALLSSAAGVEVFATNVARSFRDESELFCETTPDGRSKRYTVTDVGRTRLAEVATR